MLFSHNHDLYWRNKDTVSVKSQTRSSIRPLTQQRKARESHTRAIGPKPMLSPWSTLGPPPKQRRWGQSRRLDPCPLLFSRESHLRRFFIAYKIGHTPPRTRVSSLSCTRARLGPRAHSPHARALPCSLLPTSVPHLPPAPLTLALWGF